MTEPNRFLVRAGVWLVEPSWLELVARRRLPSPGMTSVPPALATGARGALATGARGALATGARGALATGARGALAALLLCLGACPRNPQSDVGGTGGSGGSAGDTDEPPVNSDQRLDQLSRSELQSYCRDLNDELSVRFDNRRLAAYACTRMFIQQGDTLSCNQSTNACLARSTQASLAAPRPPDYQLNNDECAAIGACRLALGVFDTCIGDRFEQSDQLMAQVNCSLANDPQAVDRLLQQIDAGRGLPASCTAVAANCPGLL